MKKITLTELEKRILKEAIGSDFFDENNEEETFICWESELHITGNMKQKRGAIASLVKKGVLRVFDEMILRTNNFSAKDIVKLTK